MVSRFSKCLLLLLIISPFIASSVQAQCITRTRNLQIVISPSFSSFLYFLNAGNGIQTDPFAIRPAGSYYLMNGLIFPEGTVDVNQTSYLVDTNGMPLTESNSLGTWLSFSKVLISHGFTSPAPLGSKFELCEHVFDFRNPCDGEANTIVDVGFSIAGLSQPFVPAVTGTYAVLGGTGCNERNGSWTSQLFIAPDLQSLLINIEFSRTVRYVA